MQSEQSTALTLYPKHAERRTPASTASVAASAGKYPRPPPLKHASVVEHSHTTVLKPLVVKSYGKECSQAKKILLGEKMEIVVNSPVAAMYYAMAHRRSHVKGPPVAI